MKRRLQVPAALLAAFAAFSALGGMPRATGLIQLPKRPIARRVADPRPSPKTLKSANAPLPTKWDARDYGWVTPAKDQGQIGTCWTFATYATLETQLLKAGKGEWDFSEKNMANLHGRIGFVANDGGNNDFAAGYLLRWSGAVAEANDPYGTINSLSDWTPSSPLAPSVHVQHIAWMPVLDGTPERIEEMKRALMEYGAVSVSMCADMEYAKYEIGGKWAFYCPVDTNVNHAVTLIGWDDNFSVDEFNTPPPSPGAWIVKNSWGSKVVGDGGCIRVSYCDQLFAREESGWVFIPAADDEDYDVVRGYDFEGPAYAVSDEYPNIGIAAVSKHDLQSSVFTAAWHERLDAVGVWSGIFPNVCEISVYTNVTRGAATPIAGGALACRQTNTLDVAGFTTIHLDSPVALAPGTSFAVVYHQTGKEVSNFVNCNYFGYFALDHKAGNCYFGYFNEGGGLEGSTWFDGKTIVRDDPWHVDPDDVSWAATIKAYTRMTVPVRKTDMPGGTDDGTAYLADLAATNSTLYAETAKTFGASIGLVGANGRSLWTSWLAGLDPSDPDDTELVATISVEGGEPRIGWSPDLGSARAYKVWGKDALGSGEEWREVDQGDPGATGAKFFKVSVGQPRQ